MAQQVLLFETAEWRDDPLGQQLAQAGFVVQRAARDRSPPLADGARPDVAVLRAEGQADAWLYRSLRALSDIPAVVICPQHDEDLIVGCHYLREKLGDDPVRPRVIVNQRGVGYRLCAVRGQG